MVDRASRCLALLALLSLAIVAGCDKGSDNPVTAVSGGTHLLYVVNNLGRTLSVVDLSTNTVTAAAATLGNSPNQVVVSNGKVYVVNSLSNTVQVFNDTTLASVGTVDIGTGTNPMCIAVTATKAYVTCFETNEVKVVDLASLAVTKSVSAGVGTTGIVLASGRVFATNTNTTISGASVTYGTGTVTVIDTTTDVVVDSIIVQQNPQAAALGPDGNVHVVCTGDYSATNGWVSVINPSTLAVTATITMGGAPASIAISPSGIAYLGSGYWTGLMSYNARTYAIIDSSTAMAVGRGGAAVACDSSGYIYLADFSSEQVLKLNSALSAVLGYDVGSGPLSLAVK